MSVFYLLRYYVFKSGPIFIRVVQYLCQISIFIGLNKITCKKK